MRTTTALIPVAAALLLTLAGCSSPTPTVTHKPSPTVAAPITGVAADKIFAWGECQQLVRKKLKAGADQLVVFSHQSTSGGAGRVTASGEASFSTVPAWSYRCEMSFDGKSKIVAESLSMGVL